MTKKKSPKLSAEKLFNLHALALWHTNNRVEHIVAECLLTADLKQLLIEHTLMKRALEAAEVLAKEANKIDRSDDAIVKAIEMFYKTLLNKKLPKELR